MTKIKCTTVAIPFDKAQKFREISGVPLSLFVRSTLNKVLRLIEVDKQPVDEVISSFMF